jgi:crotonobetainyl-CoA:carnitine CoA-transferase CaiB-like acyl-CoA transferase
MAGGPLDGVLVVEVANWVAAPSCCALMADMGANVIKVEPLGGDAMRGKLRQPSLPEDAPERNADVPFHLDNRGKRSVALDLADERGREIVRALASRADVFVTNLLPNRLARYGLESDTLLATNPRLVYALMTGYGSVGEEADRLGFDLTAFFGRGGVMGLIGEPGDPPHGFRPGQGDHTTGLALLSAVLAALLTRERTGAGQVVETALIRTAAWTIGCDLSVALVDHKHPNKRARNQAISPMGTRYRCADGWINVNAQNLEIWPRFCAALDRDDLIADPRFATPRDRFENAAELIGIFDSVFAARTCAEWAPRLDACGLPWAKVATLPELVDDPQARAIGMYTTIEHPTAGTFETLSAPFSLSASEVAVRGRAPDCGEHTTDVLRELGFDAADVDELEKAGVIRR